MPERPQRAPTPEPPPDEAPPDEAPPGEAPPAARRARLAWLLSALLVGLAAMPWLVMLIWPPSRDRCPYCVDALPLLALCTLALLRDSAAGPRLPRGEIVFPLLAVSAGLPLVSPLLAPLFLLLLPLNGLLWASLGLVLAIELGAALSRRPGLRWVRIAYAVFLSLSLVINHLLSHAVTLAAIAAGWLLGAAAYAALSRLAGPLPPERVLFGALSADARTTRQYLLLGLALAAGLLGALAIFESTLGHPVMDLPP